MPELDTTAPSSALAVPEELFKLGLGAIAREAVEHDISRAEAALRRQVRLQPPVGGNPLVAESAAWLWRSGRRDLCWFLLTEVVDAFQAEVTSIRLGMRVLVEDFLRSGFPSALTPFLDDREIDALVEEARVTIRRP